MTLPTLTELYNSIVADLQTQLDGVIIPLYGRLYLRAQAAVQAGKLRLYYLAIGALQKNIFVDTADPESIGGTLERFGRVKLNRRPQPARAAQYTCTVTGTSGSTIPAQTIYKTTDTSQNPGKLFVLDSAFTLSGSSGSVNLRAVEPGTDSALSNGNTLRITTPAAGIDAVATVTAELVQPLPAETTEDYRQKTIDAFRLEPQGGAASDYRLWAQDAQGVRTAYAYAKSGAPNEVNVYVEANPADSSDSYAVPGATILAEVEDVIEFDPDVTRPLSERGRRPLGVFDVHVLPVTVKQVNITIAGSSFTSAQQTSITNALTTEVNKIRPYVAACDVLAEKNNILDANKVISIILNAQPGSQFGAITITVAGSPYSSYTFANGDIPKLNTVTYS